MICYPVCEVIHFEIYFNFLIQAVFLHEQKSQNTLSQKYLRNDKSF